MLTHLLWLLPLVLLVYLSSPRFRGEVAYKRVRRSLEGGLDKRRYTLIHDVELPTGGGTETIEHLVLSRHGLFLIESQLVSGWVSGTAVQERWKQQFLGRSTRFENPMHRCTVRAEALARHLGIPSSRIHRLTVLVGHKGFRGEMPPGVVDTRGLLRAIRRYDRPDWEGEQVGRMVEAVQACAVRGGARRRTWPLLRVVLLLAVLVGAYLAFSDDIERLKNTWEERAERSENPADYHPDGSTKSEQERFEDRLICAWSSDTGRCSCFDPDGNRVAIETQRCRELAERGSVLRQ